MYLTNQCITYSLELQNEKAEKYCGFQPCSFKENELKPKPVIDLFKQKENKGSPQVARILCSQGIALCIAKIEESGD